MIRTGWQNGIYRADRLEITRREKEMAETDYTEAGLAEKSESAADLCSSEPGYS